MVSFRMGYAVNGGSEKSAQRGSLLLLFFTGTFLILLTKLVVVQLLQAERLELLSEGQGRINTELLPWRGTIYDRNNRELAISISTDSIYLRPKEVEEPVRVINMLSHILGEETFKIGEKLRSSEPFVWVKRKVEKEKTNLISQLKGVGKIEENKRAYPSGPVASHLVGFAGIDNYGLEGIELFFDRYLRGNPGYLSSKKDARGREIAVLRKRHSAPSEGLAVVLCLDEIIQRIVERELDRAFTTDPGDSSKLLVEGVSVIVMRPQTGEILALANRPTFDPMNFVSSTSEARRNRAITDIFEPGSCFKAIPAAAALEEKLFVPEDMIFCQNGAFPVGRHTIHDVHPYGWLSFSEVVEKSSNIGISKVGIKLGKIKLHNYIKAFGFGERTGCSLPGEVMGILRHPKRWSEVCNATISFGQGIGVTGIQLASAFSAIANGGVLMRPMVVRAIIGEEAREIKYFKPERIRRVISEKTASLMTEILTGVVKTGTGKRAALPGYEVAGKTGTAQKLNQDGTYSHTKFFSSFAGYVPAFKPELVILVAVDEPHAEPSKCYGGVVAAPVFQRIAFQSLRYLGVPSGESDRVSFEFKVTSLNDSAGTEAGRLVSVKGGLYYESHIKDENTAYLVLTEGGDPREVNVTMPQLSGISMRQVLAILRPYRLSLELRGSGICVNQNPAPGMDIHPGDKCLVVFAKGS